MDRIDFVDSEYIGISMNQSISARINRLAAILRIQSVIRWVRGRIPEKPEIQKLKVSKM